MKGNSDKNNVYGYVRVSTKDQNEDRQMIALDEAGVLIRNIFLDKQSGKDFNRPAYLRMLDRLKEGDVVIIKSIDRLGRNYEEIMEQWRIITKEKRTDIKVIDMPLLDTTKCKDLLGTFISDLVLQVLSFVSENERTNIRQRQREGIDAALAKGVQFGRPRKEHEAFEYAAGLYRQKKIPLEEALEMCDMSRSTFYRHLRGISTKDSQKVHFMRLVQNMESDPEKNSERAISPLRN